MPRPNGSGRINRLDDADFAKEIATLYVGGASLNEIAANVDCHSTTVRAWIKDPRVRAHIRTLTRERVTRVSRRLDGEVEARLAHVSDWDLDTILKVRKEYLRPVLLEDGGADEAAATNEIAEQMDQNPEFAEQLRELLAGRKAPALSAAKE